MKNGVRKAHVASFILVTCFCACFGGYAVGYTNQASKLIQAQYGWQTESETAFWGSLIGAAVFVGMAIGSASAGKLMQNGRRQTILISIIIGLVGTCLNQVSIIYFLLISRMLVGVAYGM